MTQKQIQELLKNTQTPFYVYDLKELKERILFIKRLLPERIELCYAVKANSFILKEIVKMTDWLEICSPGEYHICKDLGLPENRFVISGVFKDPVFTKKMIMKEKSIGCYTVESTKQFYILREAAEKADRKINVLLRLTSGNQFGLDEKELLRLVEEYKNDLWLNICGIQYYSGTQKFSVKKMKKELESLDNLTSLLKEKYSFYPERLEYGPGFPVAYFEEDHFNETEFLRHFINTVNNMRFDGAITLELGRSIAASCGTYFTKVVDTKFNNQKLFAIVDGGIHQLVYYGQSMAMKHPEIKKYPRREGTNRKEWNICGSLCTVNDILAKQYPLEDLQTGDVLMFEKTGAYCATEGIALFLSRDLPSIFLLDDHGIFKPARKMFPMEYLNIPLDL